MSWPLCWIGGQQYSQSREQNFVALSTGEAEYIATNVWSNMASQASERFTWPWDGSYDDNQEQCVKLLENPIFLDGSKNYEMKYPYIRDIMQKKIAYLQYLPKPKQTAYIYTK